MPISAAPALPIVESNQPCLSAAAAEAQQRLKESPYFALRNLRCDYHEGTLTVRGRVPTFYARQVAVETVRRGKPIGNLVDRIEVAT